MTAAPPPPPSADTATRPLHALAASLKAYRVTGCNQQLRLTLDAAAAADLEDLLTAVSEWDRVAAAREAAIAQAAEAARTALAHARTVQAEASAAAARVVRNAVAALLSLALVALLKVAGLVAIAGSVLPGGAP